MKISDNLYLVGSEQFALSHMLDCNCYLMDYGDGLALVDTGLGLGVDDIAGNIRNSGFDLKSLTHILLTHTHLGHWGGAQRLREMSGAAIWCLIWDLLDGTCRPGSYCAAELASRSLATQSESHTPARLTTSLPMVT